MAIKITATTNDVRLPPPSRSLIDDMAKHIYQEAARQVRLNHGVVSAAWHTLDRDQKERYLRFARAAYAAIAIAAGVAPQSIG